jgi:hypothetical protein
MRGVAHSFARHEFVRQIDLDNFLDFTGVNKLFHCPDKPQSGICQGRVEIPAKRAV